MIDETYISLGSQNFTSRGRKNKETSLMSNWDFTSTKYLNTIKEWMDNAEEVDIEYLLKLESKLKKFRPQIKKIRAEHKVVFEELTQAEIEKKRQEFLRNILLLKSQSRTAFASEFIYLTKTYIDNWENPITTYLADSGRDLRNWKVKGKEDSAFLVRLNYYPCVNTENNSIAFLRLTKTRISFYLTRISLGYFYVEDVRYHLTINCPQKNTTEINFQVILFNWRTGESTLEYYFDGSKFNFISGKFSNESDKKHLSKYVIKNKEVSNKLIKRCFKGHNMETLGISITKYFSGWWYKLFIVDYLGNAVIVAEKRK